MEKSGKARFHGSSFVEVMVAMAVVIMVAGMASKGYAAIRNRSVEQVSETAVEALATEFKILLEQNPELIDREKYLHSNGDAEDVVLARTKAVQRFFVKVQEEIPQLMGVSPGKWEEGRLYPTTLRDGSDQFVYIGVSFYDNPGVGEGGEDWPRIGTATDRRLRSGERAVDKELRVIVVAPGVELEEELFGWWGDETLYQEDLSQEWAVVQATEGSVQVFTKEEALIWEHPVVTELDGVTTEEYHRELCECVLYAYREER